MTARQHAKRNGVLVVGEHAVNIEPERAAGLLSQSAEETKDLVLAVVGAAERPDAQHVPGCILGDLLRQRGQVSLGKRVIAPACQLNVRVLGHGCLPVWPAWITRIHPRLGTIAPAAGSWHHPRGVGTCGP